MKTTSRLALVAAFACPPVLAALLFSSAHPVFNEELWMLTAINPNATEDTLHVPYGAATIASVLANDADIDGTLNATSVQVVDAPASGIATVNAGTGAISYTPSAGFTGIDSLTYRVRDTLGNWSNAAKVSIVVAQPVGGNPANPPANLTPAPMPLPQPIDPPPTTPPPSPPPRGGGGGGALGLEFALLGLLLLARGLNVAVSRRPASLRRCSAGWRARARECQRPEETGSGSAPDPSRRRWLSG